MVERWGFRLALAGGVMTLLLLASMAARAQDLPPAPELPELVVEPCPGTAGLRSYELDGSSGMWFPLDTSQCILGRLRLLQEVVPYVRLLEARLRLDDERNALQERRVELAAAEAEEARGALEAAVRRAREAEEAVDAWWRHPALWFAVGVVLTVVLEVAAVLVFSEVVP